MRIILRSYLKTLLTQELQIDIRKKGNLRGIFHDMHMHSACTVFRFCATVCKPVRPMLSDRCLSCLSGCLSVCLSVTLVYCGQTVGRIKIKLGMHVGLGPDHIVLDWDPAPHPPIKWAQPPNFRAMSVVAKWLDGLRCHLVWRYVSAQATLCNMGTQRPTKKGGHSPQFSAYVSCGQMTGIG